MADVTQPTTTAEPIVKSSQSDRRRRVAFIPRTGNENADPRSVAIIKSKGHPLTYSFTPDGFAPTGTQAKVEDKRYSLPDDLGRPGRITDELRVKYVASSDPKSADQILKPDTEGWFVERKGKSRDEPWAEDDIVNIWEVICGIQLDDAPTENGVDTVSQGMFLTAPVQRRVALTA